MKASNKLLTIVIPTKNSEHTLQATLQSINFNLCYVHLFDACSHDRTLHIAKQFPLTIHQEPDGGSHDAYNKGIQITTTPYIMFLNSDDYMMPSTLESFYATYHQHPNHDIYSLRTLFINENGSYIQDIKSQSSINLNILNRSLINSRIYKTKLFSKNNYGLFLIHYKDGRYAALGDMLWLFPLALKKIPTIPISKGGYVYSIHPHATSNTPKILSHKNNYRYLLHFLHHVLLIKSKLTKEQKSMIQSTLFETFIKCAWISIKKKSLKHTVIYLNMALSYASYYALIQFLSKLKSTTFRHIPIHKKPLNYTF